jgi:hypothetical protein
MLDVSSTDVHEQSYGYTVQKSMQALTQNDTLNFEQGLSARLQSLDSAALLILNTKQPGSVCQQ